MVRTGDIDNLGFGWPDGYDPFTDTTTPLHIFPFNPQPDDPPGTDRILVGSSFTGKSSPVEDGYSTTTARPANNAVPITLTYNLQGKPVTGATLQIFADDLQSPVLGSDFHVTLNGARAPFLERILNSLDMTGPIGELVTVPFPQDFLPLLTGGILSIQIDDPTTGVGDGFAIDFVKLLINPTPIGPRPYRRGDWSLIASVGALPPGEFHGIEAFAIDPKGNLFVAGDNQLEEKDTSGSWTVLASAGSIGGTSQSRIRLAVDQADDLFVSDEVNNRVEERSADGTWSIVAPSGKELGEVGVPWGVAVDQAGDLYVADFGNDRVEERSANGTWSIVAPSGKDLGEVFSPMEVGVDKNGDLFVSDYYSSYFIQERDTRGNWTRITTWDANSKPWDWVVFTFDRQDDLYIAKSAQNLVEKRDTEGNWIPVAGPGLDQVSYPAVIGFDPAGSLYVLGGEGLQKRDLRGQWSLATLPPSIGITGPEGLALDSSGNLFLSDLSSQLLEMSVAGQWSVVAPSGSGLGEVNQPHGLSLDGAGNLFVSDSQNNRVQERNVQGKWSVLASAGSDLGQVNYPDGLVLDAEGDLFVTDYNNNRIQKRDPKGNWSIIAGPGGDLGQVRMPEGLALDARGDLYVADTYNYRVQKRDPSGNWSVLAEPQTPLGGRFSPTNLATDLRGDLYISEICSYENGNRIRKLDQQGHSITLSTFGDLPGKARHPTGLAVDSDGDLYVTEDGSLGGKPRVQKFIPSRPSFLFDMNGDGRISIPDAILSLEIAVGSLLPTPYQKAAGDINDDGRLGISDAILILQKAIGL